MPLEGNEAKAFSSFAGGNFSDAIRFCNALLNDNPNNPLCLVNRAAAHFRMDLYKHAIKDCDAALSIDNSCQRAYLTKGSALHAMGRKPDAVAVWKAGSSFGGDVELYVELLRLAGGGNPSSSPRASEQQRPQEQSGGSDSRGDEPQGVTYDRSQDGSWIVRSSSSSNSKVFSVPADPSSTAVSAMVAARGMVQHGIGKAEVDEKIALGYLQVNTGNYAIGIEMFSNLLQKDSRIIAAYLGRGTAYALSGELDKSVVDFSAAIEVDRTCTDAWKRRGQARAARGHDIDAISDLTQAISLSTDTDVETYHQRGLVYYKQRNYRRALADFKKATTIDKQSKLSWNHMGLCLNAIGSAYESIEAHTRAIAIDGKFKEAWANMAQAYKDLGIPDKAFQLFSKSIEIDGGYAHSYHLRALFRFGVGDHLLAIDDLDSAARLEPSNKEFRHMRGVIFHGVGLYKPAVMDYTTVVNSKADHVAWYQREVALFSHHHLDVPLNDFNIDVEMDPYFKEGWCKRNHPAALYKYKPQIPLNESISDVTHSKTPVSTDTRVLIEACSPFGKQLQYNTAGYLPNKRQHRMAGLAILDIAQRLRSGVWRIGGVGDILYGKSDHKFGWRDLYDIPVKWRQYSEPNDPVWWVDLLSPEQFNEGFGSHTPIITGQTHVIRYYPMFARSFAIMKELIPAQHTLDEAMKSSLAECKDCKDLYDIMRRDFWVVTPCHSTSRPDHIMEGTRLTLQYSPPEGFEYSIRTPGTPQRWADYNTELTNLWDVLCSEASKPEPDIDRVSDLILAMTFYWYNFMPLSRGSAAVGYITLLGMFLAMGIQINTTIKQDQQPDWEGILRPTPTDFISVIKPWMYPSRTFVDIIRKNERVLSPPLAFQQYILEKMRNN